MTEAEWLTCEHLRPCFQFLAGMATLRKQSLFSCACCYRVWDQLTDSRSRSAVETSERFADSLATADECAAATLQAREAYRAVALHANPRRHSDFPAEAACHAADAAIHASRTGAGRSQFSGDPAVVAAAARNVVRYVVAAALRPETPSQDLATSAVAKAAMQKEGAAQMHLLRDIFGNPFRPVAVDPAWLTSDVVMLAHGIYDEKAFDRMPILADALQDAGCANDDVLTHCRGAGPHVRGCWVVDLLLGKG